jgi:hypothetical protein
VAIPQEKGHTSLRSPGRRHNSLQAVKKRTYISPTGNGTMNTRILARKLIIILADIVEKYTEKKTGKER